MHDLVRRSYRAIVTGMVDDVTDYIHNDFVNDEATNEPPAAEAGGPWGFATTVAWLRTAYSELDVIEHEFMQDADRYVSEVTMRGTHTGPWWSVMATGTSYSRRPDGASRTGRCTQGA